MKKILYITLLLLLPYTLLAQKAFDQMLSHINPKDGLKIEFKMSDPIDSTKFSNGTYYAQGKSFYIETNSLKAWYNGQYLWVYVYQNGEINLSAPTADDLADLNPLTNLDRLRQQNFNINEKSLPSGETDLVATPPTNYNGSIKNIMIRLNKTMSPTLLTVMDNSIEKPLTIQILKLEKGVKLNPAIFRFETSKAPGISVIDLR